MADSTLRGAALLATAVNHILAHPETWDQQKWHCGAKHCIAGHCELLATGKETRDTSDIAQELLGITVAEADWLFDPRRTLREIYGFAEAMLSDTRFDRDGYDGRGYDRWGRNREGYDREGYDREGRDREGNPLPPLVIPATDRRHAPTANRPADSSPRGKTHRSGLDSVRNCQRARR